MGSIPGWLTGIPYATLLKSKQTNKKKPTTEQAERKKISTPITLDQAQIFQK